MNNIRSLILNGSLTKLGKNNLMKRLVSSGPDVKQKSHLWLLSFPIASFCLGTWQIKRLKWKQGLIRELEARSQCEAVNYKPDMMDPTILKDMEYKRLIINGRFDHDKEILLGPRSLNTGSNQQGGLGSRPTSGYHVITPFILDNGQRILINRGWVPNNKRNPATRPEGQITEETQITGCVRLSEKRPQFSPKVKEQSYIWHYCDVNSFSELLKTEPLMLDADATSTVPEGPIGGQTRVTLRNEHMQYIITWYSLSLATLFLYNQFRKRPVI